ncbi:unnamed protein product [Rotaria socialis]|uniref:Exportin-5 n=1 Tax=Rotaria socialis TaxID=392032 RepID=A0A818AAG9_9BILA|nr:unnamed protein product [Rotaria socialis]CAF4656832.1 unnamed protein product [Rotaria socialis]
MTHLEFLRRIETAVLSCVSSDPIHRQQAYKFVEEIKSNPIQSISIGFEFFNKNQLFDPLVKHFGLQCIEETIKYKWTSLDSQLKLSIKERLWLLMTEHDQLPVHLKTILVRCVCEIAKREWPQQWPLFLDELVALSKLNSTNDYSLLILAYLIEDVIVLQTLNSIRKRDIQTTLLQHGNKLVEFIEYFLDLPNTISSSLYALTMFATFLPIDLFFTTKIIHKIVLLLNSPIHRMKAAEFLSVISDRRGKYEERLPLLQLFLYLFQNGSHYNDVYSTVDIKQSNDMYDFMKQYAMVITALCDQLCYLCGGEGLNKKAPLPEQCSNGTFLQLLLALMQHPSIYIALYGYQMWLQLVRANIIQENDYQNILPLIFRALCHSLVKQPYKKTNDGQDVALSYIHHDFEDEPDYQKFIGKNRAILIRSINIICNTSEHLSIAIRIGFDYADYCFQSVNIQNLLLFESLVSYWQIIEKHLRLLLKPLEPFNNRKLLSSTDELSFCQRGQALIEKLLSINNDNNLEFLAYSLRLLTNLYVFTRGENTWTQRILEHLFRTITTERQMVPKSNPLQKQASCLIDLCLNYGHTIVIYFNDLFKVTQDLVRQQTSMEQQTKLAGWQWSILVECLAILLNHFESFEQKAIFINELVQPFAQILSKFDLHVNDLRSFIDYIGLKPTPDAISASNQRLIFLSIHILCGLLRRITLPTDPTICSNGGYQETFDGIVYIRNPAAPSFIQLTHCFFKLLTYCHALHSPDSPLSKSSLSFLSTMTDADKAVYLQQQDNNEDANILSTTQTNSPILSTNDRRLHNRFSSFLDRLEILIGTYLTLKPDLYKLKDSLNIIGTTLFSSLEYIPDFRLQNIVRYCFLPFVRHCPMSTIMIPIFESLLPFMYTKLKDKWKIITERQSIKVTNGNIHESNDNLYQTQERCEEEVIEEQVTCYLTRDFIGVIKNLLIRQHNNSDNLGQLSNGNDIDETSMDEIMITTDEQSRKPSGQTRYHQMPSDFALKVLQDSPIICQYCLLILFDGLSWPDTSSVTKMAQICQALVKHLSILINGNNDFLRQLYIYILCALKIHGDNEPIACTLLSLATLMYDTFQQTSSNLFDSVHMEIPDVTNEQVNNYRDKMLRQVSGKPLSDKQKRDILKQLVQPLMGQNVAQMFKREPLALNNLPPLIRFSKRSLHPVLQHHQQSNVDNEDDHGLANLFQHTDD